MRKLQLKKQVSMLCAMAIVASSFTAFSPNAKASGLGYWPESLPYPNQSYYQNESLQPYGSCFQIDELKNWSPDNDPDARYNRSGITLKNRWMGPSVNPKASRDAKVMPLAMSNARASEAPSQGGDGDFVYAFTNFQYVDTYNFWGGSSAEGPIAIPSPEHIDSAHRNGVPATGTIFIPWGDESYGSRFVTELVEKTEDGKYPAADKLIEIAQYYGFDGYIFNAESGTSVSGFKDFLKYIQNNKPDGFEISWYNGSGRLSESSINSWMQSGDEQITDNWWLDMSGSGDVDSTIAAAEKTGVNPWNIHSTWEYWPMASGAKGGNYQARLNADGILKASLGILAPTVTLTQSASSDDFQNVQDQKLWTGPSFNPSVVNRPQYEFCGFGNLVADKTPIIGTEFATTFNTGNGLKFYENGKVTGKENGWYNRSLTEVLPTWRWIIDSEGKKLSAKIDYNDAYYAGTSLKLYGNMDANKSNHIKLYSSQLDITSTSTFSITYKSNNDEANLSLGLCFGDDYSDSNFKFYDVATTTNGEYTTKTFDLSADAGKKAIAISLKVEADEEINNLAINVGRIAFTTSNNAPSAVSDVTLDEVIFPSDTSMEARIYWTKTDDTFITTVHRVLEDGTKEYIGATPSDALYLGSLNREGDETKANFELTSYSETGLKGTVKTFSIDWTKKVENGFVLPFDEGDNLLLGKPAVSTVTAVADGPVDKINDGVIANSKWCSSSVPGAAVIDLGKDTDISRWVVYHANAKGAGEGVAMNTVAFDLSYAADDGKSLLTGDDSASKARVREMSFTSADSVTNNKQDVTDRNLDTKITARYLKLNVTQSDSSPWHAIRVYEFEAYENAAICNTASPLERNVTVKNTVGANDTAIFDNVTMKYSSGTYADNNGVIDANTGIVKLYTDLTSKTPIAEKKATQPDENYKQRSVGIAEFEGLDLETNGGRLFYEVTDASSGNILVSRRASIAFAPESGDAITKPDSVKVKGSTYGTQLRFKYATVTATGLEDGTTMKFFSSSDSKTPLLQSLEAKNGTITQERVPLTGYEEDGDQNIYYELQKDGKPDSQRFAVSYEEFDSLEADLKGLKELVEKCNKIERNDCTTSTFSNFNSKLTAAKSLMNLSSVTSKQAYEASLALRKAYGELRFKADTQRLDEVADELFNSVDENDYTEISYGAFKSAYEASVELISMNNSSEREVELSRINLEKTYRELTEKLKVTGVTVTPSTADVKKGSSKIFTAKVEGAGTPSQDVTWAVTGKTSEDTVIVSGKLTVGADETATTLEVKATAVEDTSVSGTASVTVLDAVDPDGKQVVSENATILGVGSTTGTGNDTASKAFDGDLSTKWCSEKTPNWMVFDITSTASIKNLKVVHAGGATPTEDSRFDTNDFELQVLNQDVISEYKFLKLSSEEQKAIMMDESNWKTVKHYETNELDITDDEISNDVPVRIMRFKVTDGDDNWWNGPDTLRIYEVEITGIYETVPDPVIVEINPKNLTVDNNPGQKGQFTATVENASDDTVTWTIEGNTSDETSIVNGQLFFGTDETATSMTVKATSNQDSKSFATATVTVNIIKYNVTVGSMTNGTVTTDVDKAAKGETVTITVTPDEGFILKVGTLKVNGVAVSGTTFTMPNDDAIIVAEFIADPRIAAKEELKGKVNEAEALDLTPYTDDSVLALKNAIATAKEKIESSTATLEDIKGALTALNSSIDGLTKKPVVTPPTTTPPTTNPPTETVKTILETIKGAIKDSINKAVSIIKDAISNVLVDTSKLTDAEKEILNKMTDDEFNEEVKNISDAVGSLKINESTDKLSSYLKKKGINSGVTTLTFVKDATFKFGVNVETDLSATTITDGTKYLYYYNSEKDTLEFCSKISVTEKVANYMLNHCSEYVISDTELNTETTTDGSVSNPKTGSNIPAAAATILALSAIVVFKKKKK